MERIMWLVLGGTAFVAALRAGSSPRALYVARVALGVLMIAFGAVVNAVYLMVDSATYAHFADASQLTFVRDTWQSLVVPNQELFISVLIGFELLVGVLMLSGGRRTQVALVALIAFHAGQLVFGWFMWLWAVPMMTALVLLLRAELRRSAAATPVRPSRKMPEGSGQKRRRLLIAAVGVTNAAGAGLGAVGLATGWLELGPTLTARLPWGSAVAGAVALAVVVALPNALLAIIALRRDSGYGTTSIASGVLLVGWIVVQLAFIREVSLFHPLYAGIGVLQVLLGARAFQERSGVAGQELLREVRDVLADLPVFLTSPLYRRWHLTWNATPIEVDAPMPGDDLLVRPHYVSTRAITVDAPPDRVWPWLVQMGCLRAGFYSNDLLDNLGRPSSRTLLPELQRIEVGQMVPMSPNPTVGTSFRVASFAAPHELLWTKPDSTWAWRLTKVAPDRTRIVTRIRGMHDWHRPATGLLSLLLLELGDFAMLRRMLRGIKQRAESSPARDDNLTRRPAPASSRSRRR
jgi:hypothetical protein